MTMKTEASEVTGPLFDYLGHFRQSKWLEQGHNDVGENDDNQLDQIQAQIYGAAAPASVGAPGATGLAGATGMPNSDQ